MAAVGRIEVSFFRAVPHFLPLLLFTLLVVAAQSGGWWLAGPYAFMVANSLDPVFGLEERNIDPKNTPEASLFWYKLPVWTWAVMWTFTLAFVLWQILAGGGDLAVWERVVLVILLSMAAPLVYMISHEFIHRHAWWERRIGDFLVAPVPWPIYATEHLYIHHANEC